MRRHRALVGQQVPAFAPIEPGQRPAMGVGVRGPLGRVDIDEVDQHRQAAGRCAYCAIDDENTTAASKPARCHPVANPGMHAGIAVVGEGQRLSGPQAAEAPDSGHRRVQSHGVHLGTPLAHGRHMAFVVRVVDEGAQTTSWRAARWRRRW